jgi:signal transduction histidine kinase
MIQGKSFVLLFIIFFIGFLLLLNFFALKRNSNIINQNKEEMEAATQVRVQCSEVLSNIHLLDLGLRGIALVANAQLESSIDSAIIRKDKIYQTLYSSLTRQGYPSYKLQKLKDTIDGYFVWTNLIRKKIKEGDKESATQMISEDRGYGVWHYHQQVSKEIYHFEDQITSIAGIEYRAALQKNYLLQGLMFLIILPTLGYLAYYTIRSFKLSYQLLRAEEEKNTLLQWQNETLEKMVLERTKEIATQNEEIVAQNEEIQAHNEQLIEQQKEIEKQSQLLIAKNNQLEEAREIISRQKEIIQKENLQLAFELEEQNKELRATNYELVQKTTRIEQFAYMISHNLRAPIARLFGLTNIFKYANSKKELDELIDKTQVSAKELDQVVKDLSGIMQIQRLSTDVFSEIDFERTLQKAKQILEHEIEETNTEFQTDFKEKSFYSLPAYIDNIFFNLISNSIKYRNPEKKPLITISTKAEGNFIIIQFSDNGLGLNTEVHKENLFGLYKRFHLHVDGRGIGLYLIKSQIEMLDGKIEIHSKVDKGTTFKIYLPRKKEAQPSEEK